ncbi:hypothetical protein ABXN37_18130 [Piscinibacter sakaiensis]
MITTTDAAATVAVAVRGASAAPRGGCAVIALAVPAKGSGV